MEDSKGDMSFLKLSSTSSLHSIPSMGALAGAEEK